MGINLMAALGYDEDSTEVKQARGFARMYAEVIGELVDYRENTAGLTQTQVAKRMGTTQSAISEFESASSDVRFSTMIRYAQAIGCEFLVEVSEPVVDKTWSNVEMRKTIPFESEKFQQRPDSYVPNLQAKLA